jgi:hypothetical protein
VKRARRDEQNVVGRDVAVFGHDAAAFHDGQNVALHALARDFGAVAAFASRHFVDFVDEQNAVFLHALDGFGDDGFAID